MLVHVVRQARTTARQARQTALVAARAESVLPVMTVVK